MKLWNVLTVILVVLSSVYFVNIFQIEENISSFELNNVNVDSQVKINLDEANKQLTVNYNSKKIKTIKFNNVNLDTINDSKLQINNDLLLNKTEETFKEEVNFEASENIVDAFSIDPSNVDFDNGSMEVVASGKKLWKCKDWNFTTQTCFGEWKLVKLLQPGEVYDIELYQGDPGFIETDFDKRIKAMLVYRESGSTDIRYRYLNNSYEITSELTAFTVGGFPRWMELQANPLYDEYLYGTHTADQDIEIAIFNGTDWINQLAVTTNAMPETRRAFDVAYEGDSGEGLVVYSEDNSNNIKYRTWDGTIFSSEQQFNMGASDNFVWTKLISRPDNDEILFLGIWEDSGGDEYIVASIWNGATFTNTITLLSNENLQEEEVLDGTYVNDEWLVVHADGGSNSPVYRTFDGSWSSQATVANFGAQPRWIELETSSDGDDALLCAQDSSRDLNCMYWNGNSWQDQDEIDTDLEENTFKNFDIAPFTNSNDFMITFGERSQDQYDYEIYDPDLGSYTRFAMDTGTTDNDWMMLERDPCEDYFLAFTLDDGADYELQLYNNSWTKYSQIDPNGFNQYRNADIIFSPICTIPLGDAGTNVFNETNSDFFSFNTGVFNNTVLDTSIPALTLDGSSSGTYTSQVFNANDTVSWQNISLNITSGNISSSGLVLDLELENTSWIDSTVNSNDATCTNCPSSVTGQVGNAADFDGTNDYLEVSDIAPYEIDEGSLSFYFNADTLSTAGLFSKDSTGFDTGGHITVYTETNQVKVRLQSTSTSYFIESGTISAGQWYKVLVTWGADGFKLFLDENLVDSDPYTGGLDGNNEPIVIGANSWSSNDLSATPVQDYFDGKIDDVKIFDSQLEPDELEMGDLEITTSVRSCDDSLCIGESFTQLGTDSFYNLSLIDNQYFQYELLLNGSEDAYISNISIGYDQVDPNQVEVSLISPFNNSIDGNGLINFTYTTINSQNLDYCVFVLDNIIEFNETNPILGVNSYLQDQISIGAHTWYVNCTNANGFTNTSEVYSFEIDSPVAPTLIQINESVEDAGNNLVTGAIELFDFYSGELDYSTNSGSPQSISTGTYNIKISPSSVFEEIMFYGVNITSDIDEIIDIDESNSDPKWSREFSFDTKIPFDYQNVTLTYNANSKDTFRCLNWDFDNSLCIGDNWIKEMDTIPGQNYSINFEANELKGYAEYGKDIVVLNKSNYLIDSDQTENPINGTNSDYDVTPQFGPFSFIEVNSHLTSPTSDNEIVVSSFDDIYFEKSFGIDPEGIDANSLNITFDNNVSGFYLFKCSNFTISIDECNNEDYIQEFVGLNTGDNWIVIDPTDPGFGITIQGPSNLNDSYFRQGAPNNNFGGSSNIRVGKSGSATNPIRGIIQFDISNLPSGVQVIDSNLSLYFFNIPFFDTGASRTHGVHRIDTNKNWQELEITWNDINSTGSWTTAGGDFAASPTDTQSVGASDINSRIKWNVTDDLNYYINNPTQNFGWVIRDQDESTTNTRRDYRSKDWSNVSQRPELEIFFIDIEPPQVTNLIPTNGSEFINGTIIEIGANVTDNINVSSVFANISYPNGTIITIPLSLQFASFYNASFTIPLDGLYNVSYFANDTDGLINDTQATQFSTILFPEITGSKSAQSNPVVEGTMFNYTITINNNGLGDAQNMTVLEIYPDNVSFVSANPAPTSGNDTWFFSSIAGGSSQIITIQVELENGTAGSSLLNKVNLSYFNQSNLVEIDFNNTVNVIQNVGAAAFGIHLSITPNHAEPDDLVLIELHSNYLNITSTNLTIYRIFDNVTYPIGSFEMTDLNPSIWFYELNASENVFGNYLAVVDAIVTGGQPYRDSKTFSILPRGIIDFVGRTPNTYEVNESVILGAEIRRNEETFNDGLENPRLLIYKDDILIQELNSSSGLILNDSLFLVNYTFNQTGSYLLEWFVDYYNRSKVTREIIGITKIDTEEKNENIVNLINQNMDKLDQVITTTEEIQEFSQEEIFLITDSINSVNKVGKEAEKDSIKSLENKLEELQKHNQVENSNLVTGSAISDILTVSTKSSSTSMLFVALVILIMLVFAKKPIQKGLSKIRFRKRESKVPSKLINTQPAKVSPQKKTTKTALIKKKMMSFTNWNGFRKTNSDISISKSKKVNKQFTPKVKTNRFSLVMDNALGIKKQKGFSSKQTQYLNNMFEDLKKYVQEKNRSASSNKDSFKLSTVRKKPNSKLAAKFSSNLKKYVESEIKINEGKSIRLSEVDQTFFRNDKGGSRENKIVAATENSAFRDDFFDFEENKSKRQIDSQESNASDNFFVSLNNVKDKVASAWKDDFADLTQSNNNLRVEDSISKKSFEGKHAKSGKGKDNNDSDKNKIDWSIMDGNLK